MTVKTRTRAKIECNTKSIKYEVMKMMTMMMSKKTAVNVSKMKAEMKLRTMKKLVKTIPRTDFEYNRNSDDYLNNTQ